MFMAKCHHRTRERVKGNTAFPFTIPAAPQRNRCFALRSPPAPLPAVGLTRVTRPIPGARPSGQRVALFKIVPDDFVLSRQTSVRHPWRPDLVIGSSSHRFQRGLNPSLHALRQRVTKISLWFSPSLRVWEKALPHHLKVNSAQQLRNLSRLAVADLLTVYAYHRPDKGGG